jgi:hypothetical protein
VEKDLLKRSRHYADILQERLLAKENELKEEKKKNVDIYDKAFFLNEEMNDLKDQLENMGKNFTSSDD